MIIEIARDLLEHPGALVVASNEDLAGGLAAVGLDVLIGAIDRPGGLLPAPLVSPLDSSASRSGVFPSYQSPVVLVIGANPLYLAHPSSGWSEGLARARFVACAGSFADETAEAAHLSSTAGRFLVFFLHTRESVLRKEEMSLI